AISKDSMTAEMTGSKARGTRFRQTPVRIVPSEFKPSSGSRIIEAITSRIRPNASDSIARARGRAVARVRVRDSGAGAGARLLDCASSAVGGSDLDAQFRGGCRAFLGGE